MARQYDTESRRELRERIAELEAERDDARNESNERADFMRREGYRRCDIAACNCNSWHGGRAGDRLREIYEVLGERVNGQLPITVIEGLIETEDRLLAWERTCKEGESDGN